MKWSMLRDWSSLRSWKDRIWRNFRRKKPKKLLPNGKSTDVPAITEETTRSRTAKDGNEIGNPETTVTADAAGNAAATETRTATPKRTAETGLTGKTVIITATGKNVLPKTEADMIIRISICRRQKSRNRISVEDMNARLTTDGKKDARNASVRIAAEKMTGTASMAEEITTTAVRITMAKDKTEHPTVRVIHKKGKTNKKEHL